MRMLELGIKIDITQNWDACIFHIISSRDVISQIAAYMQGLLSLNGTLERLASRSPCFQDCLRELVLIHLALAQFYCN